MNLIELFSTIPFFASLTTDEVEKITSNLPIDYVAEGSLILEEGHQDNKFYILVDGWVEIIKALGLEGERFLGKRTAGTVLGEMSMFSVDGTHSASVRALTPVKLIRFTREGFKQLLHEQPEITFEMVRVYGQRLMETETMTILDLKEKNRQLTLAYEELKNAQAQIIEKEKLEHELEIARQIQQRLLPQEFPVIKNYKIGALMIPARAVGGDFFDFIPISDQLLGIVIGDVSDKGVPAALFMSLTYSLLHAEASRGGTPAEILKRVNHHLMNINSSDMFVTMILGILNLETHELDFARAGHPLPLIINKEYSPLNLKIQMGQPLGILDDPKLDDQQVKLPHGSIVIFFSDGLSETMNQKGDFFGEQRILQIVKESSKTNIQMICDKLWQAVQKFSEDIPQQDDFTIVAIQVS